MRQYEESETKKQKLCSAGQIIQEISSEFGVQNLALVDSDFSAHASNLISVDEVVQNVHDKFTLNATSKSLPNLLTWLASSSVTRKSKAIVNLAFDSTQQEISSLVVETSCQDAVVLNASNLQQVYELSVLAHLILLSNLSSLAIILLPSDLVKTLQTIQICQYKLTPPMNASISDLISFTNFSQVKDTVRFDETKHIFDVLVLKPSIHLLSPDSLTSSIPGKVFVRGDRRGEPFKLIAEVISSLNLPTSLSSYSMQKPEPSGYIPDLIKITKVILLSSDAVSKYVNTAKTLCENLNLHVSLTTEKIDQTNLVFVTLYSGTIEIDMEEVSGFDFVDLCVIEDPYALFKEETRLQIFSLLKSVFKPSKLLIPGGASSLISAYLNIHQVFSVSELENMEHAMLQALQDHKSGFNIRQILSHDIELTEVIPQNDVTEFESTLPEVVSFLSLDVTTVDESISSELNIDKKEYINKLESLDSSIKVLDCNDLGETFGKFLTDTQKDPSLWIAPEFTSIESTFAAVRHFVTSSDFSSSKLLLCNFPSNVSNNVALYTMQYGDTYVTSINLKVNLKQGINSLIEANSYNGKSIVICGMKHLYRWNPYEDPKFKLDSINIKKEMEKFLKAEGQLTIMANEQLIALNSNNSLEAKLKEQYINLLSQKPKSSTTEEEEDTAERIAVLILYGSDSGNAQGIAEKVNAMAKSQSQIVIKTRVSEANEYTLDELLDLDVDKEEFEYTSKKNMNSGIETDKLKKIVIFVLATAGQGEPTMNSKSLYDEIISSKQSNKNINISYSVFGLGDSHYWGKDSPDSEKYFCLPARLLDTKLSSIGLNQLIQSGLGDDQDDDGYTTEFNTWVNNLFTSLDLKIDPKAVQDLTPQIVDDDIKENSGYLRGNIDDGLSDLTTLKLLPEDTKLTKFHGIYQQDLRSVREEHDLNHIERAYSFMIRVGLPGGVCTAQQVIDMLNICNTYANGVLKITTRQAFQLHGVVKKDMKKTMQAINKGCMNTLAACGDVNRNVIANPYNTIATSPKDTKRDFISIMSQHLDTHLRPKTSAYHEIWLNKKKVYGFGESDYEPIYGRGYLPRKFKIAIAVPPLNDVDVFSHCLGFVAITDKTKNNALLGFNVSVGGGMGTTHNNPLTYPKLAPLLGYIAYDAKRSQEENLALLTRVAESVVILQRDHGERVNRKHARLKYTVEDKGIEWFKKEVKRMLGKDGDKLEKPRKFKFSRNADEFGWAKTGENNGENIYKCMLFVENGVVKDENKEGLVEIGKYFQSLVSSEEEDSNTLPPMFALTANQHIGLLHVPEKAKAHVTKLLEKYKLDRHASVSQLRMHSMACVALPTCALAMAESQRYMPSLITKVEDILKDLGIPDAAIMMRMTGCPNGCARPYMAEVGFVGKAPGQYNMYLGGGYAGNRLNKLYKEGIDEKEILVILRELLGRYKVEGKEDEKFGDFVIRVGVIEPTLDGKFFWKSGDENMTQGKAQVYW